MEFVKVIAYAHTQCTPGSAVCAGIYFKRCERHQSRRRRRRNDFSWIRLVTLFEVLHTAGVRVDFAAFVAFNRQ